MVRDAEEHADEDKKAKDLVQAKNEADTIIYSLEKMIKENEGKINPSEKQSIESEINNLRSAISANNIDEIRTAKGKLEQVSHKFAERIYKESAQSANTGAGAGTGSGASGAGAAEAESSDNKNAGQKVYDADYTVVDEDKDK
jgi:molecular chaperone DnaK